MSDPITQFHNANNQVPLKVNNGEFFSSLASTVWKQLKLRNYLNIFHHSGSVVSIDSPNEKLFKLLLESMERLNDREVTLTDFSSLRFIQHLQNRKRNDIPLPFPGELCDMEQCIQSTSGEDHNGKDIQKKSVPSTKWRCFVRAVTACGSDRLILTFLPASFKHVRLMAKHGHKGSSSTGSAPRSPHRGTEKGTMEASKECGFGEAANIEEKHKSSLLPQSSLEGKVDLKLVSKEQFVDLICRIFVSCIEFTSFKVMSVKGWLTDSSLNQSRG